MGAQRNTRQRELITEELRRHPEFASAQQLHTRLAAREKIGLATVYRNLTALVADGTIDTIRSEDGQQLYRWCGEPQHHHHLVCRSCGKTVDVAAPPLEEWIGQVAQANGFTAIEHTADLFGLCETCSRA
ncbi:MAG: transcriptional repressor [Varibaculum sp.]|nr:transcriptional repressor [Varibaculum sp.]